MEVWVRSQDRERFSLTKDVRFGIYKKCALDKEMHTMKEFMESGEAYCVECNLEVFGEYPTKERCLEIIDEIQKLFSRGLTVMNVEATKEVLDKINGLPYVIPSQNQYVEYHEQSVVVYEMPKE